MPRQSRQPSGTGIYHVMLRGIRSAMPLATVGTQERHGILMTLLRYIHQNPLKAGIVKKVGDYEWSSWSEYTGKVPAAVCLCAINAVYKRITIEEK